MVIDFIRVESESRWFGEVSKLSLEERWVRLGRIGGDGCVRERPRRDSRVVKRVDKADNCVVSCGEYVSV